MQISINGKAHDVSEADAARPLLWFLRDRAGMHSVKFGCGGGFCAACTVLVDGKAVKSCQVRPAQVMGKDLRTVDHQDDPVVRALSHSWVETNVVQCGYCQPAQILAAAALLKSGRPVTDDSIDAAMSGNICRCGTYPRIRKAIKAAAALLKDGTDVNPPLSRMERADDDTPQPRADGVRPYVELLADGTVLVRSSQLEMGQGGFTAVATVVAEELDVPLERIRVVHAANQPEAYGNTAFGEADQVTGASTSAGNYVSRYRMAAAKLRSGTPKDPALYRMSGHDGITRVDGAAKTLGRAEFTIDLTWPGMLTAVPVHAPRIGGKLAGFDATAAKSIPGVVEVIATSQGALVLGDGFAAAQEGAASLHCDWNNSTAETRSSAELSAQHHALLDSGTGVSVLKRGAIGQSNDALTSTYEVPYVAHGQMEPLNAAARMRSDGILEVWVAWQTPRSVIEAAMAASGLPRERIEVHMPYAGGGFGLRVAPNPPAVIEAVEACKALGWKHPVKVQYTRQAELALGYMRPMDVVRLTGKATADGIEFLSGRMIVQSISKGHLPTLRGGQISNGIDILSVEGLNGLPYQVENVNIDIVDFDDRMPSATWRSPGANANEFARESFVDELAEQAGVDPLAFRRQLLAQSPRMLAVLDRAVALAGTPAAGAAQGFAVSTNSRGFSAFVVQVSLSPSGKVGVDKVVLAVDVGRAINPDQVRAQLESGIVWGISSALFGESLIEDGAVKTLNFDSLIVARMGDVPEVIVDVAQSTEPTAGVGEIAVPGLAPALANAITRLTGNRPRAMPFAKTVPLRQPRDKDSAKPTVFRLTQNGPILVEGAVTVTDHDGAKVQLPGTLALCRCGASANKPFCDGSHFGTGFDGTVPPEMKSAP